MMNTRFILTGGPGAGKTTVLDHLARRGYQIAPESARQIIRDRLAAGLTPRPSPVVFANEVLRSDRDQYRDSGLASQPRFFDRGVPDALYMLNAAEALSSGEIESQMRRFTYNRLVFLLPPWREIYSTDSERDQSFEESKRVFNGLKHWYTRWGYELLEVPRVEVEQRVAFILEHSGTVLATPQDLPDTTAGPERSEHR